MSDEEAMAKALGEIMNQHDERFDARLELYAAGRLSDEERRDLEERAKVDPEMALALELHRPLGPVFKAKLVETATAEVAQGSRGKVLSFRKPVIALLAAAASIALAFVLLQPGQEATIPKYSLSARTGDAEWRGESAPAKKEARADSELQIVLRPQEPVRVPVEAVLFVIQGDVKARSPVTAEISEDGAVRWIGRASELSGGRTGELRLIAEVGPPEKPAWLSTAIEVSIR